MRSGAPTCYALSSGLKSRSEARAAATDSARAAKSLFSPVSTTSPYPLIRRSISPPETEFLKTKESPANAKFLEISKSQQLTGEDKNETVKK